MTELQQAYGSLDVDQLHEELTRLIAGGESLGGTICSYIADRIDMLKEYHGYFRSFMFDEYTQTVRTKMTNYWVASVKDGQLVFDSWEDQIKGRIDEAEVRYLWSTGKLPKDHR